jgi:hypothetical protein
MFGPDSPEHVDPVADTVFGDVVWTGDINVLIKGINSLENPENSKVFEDFQHNLAETTSFFWKDCRGFEAFDFERVGRARIDERTLFRRVVTHLVRSDLKYLEIS